jgi:hypothetical protein
VLVNRIKMQGFIVFDFAARHPEAVKDLAGWLAAGQLKYRETIAQGVEAAPSAFIATRCMSIGRVPMAHPPGMETRAWPQRATSGPRTQKLARMRLTIS